MSELTAWSLYKKQKYVLGVKEREMKGGLLGIVCPHWGVEVSIMRYHDVARLYIVLHGQKTDWNLSVATCYRSELQ